MNKNSIEAGQPEQVPVNEQKADNISSSQVSANALVGRSAGKNVSYRGYKAVLPENVSMNAFKQIVEISSGFDYCIQPFINLLSNQLKSQSHVR